MDLGVCRARLDIRGPYSYGSVPVAQLDHTPPRHGRGEPELPAGPAGSGMTATRAQYT